MLNVSTAALQAAVDGPPRKLKPSVFGGLQTSADPAASATDQL